MASHAPSLFVSLLLLGASAPAAFAEVYQCANPAGRVLLTDSPCPSGFDTKFVAKDTHPAAPVGASSQRQARSEPAAAADQARLAAAEAEAAMLRAQLEAERLRDELAQAQLLPSEPAVADQARLAAAEAEAAILRAQLETERLRAELAQEQLSAIDRQLGAADDGVVVGYGVVGSVLVPGWSWHDGKPGKHGRPCLDCRPPHDFKPKFIPRDSATSCGTFGCTPSITRTPRDDRRGLSAGNRVRLEKGGAMPRRGARPPSAPRSRF